MSTQRPGDRDGRKQPPIVSLPRRRDDHSASRRVDVLLQEAPHLLADDYHRRLWNARAAFCLALALLAGAIGWALSAFYYPHAGHLAYNVALLLVLVAAIARGVANREARR